MATPQRRRRLRKTIALSVLALLLLLVTCFLTYASLPTLAEPKPLAAVRDDPALRLRETGDAVVLTPTSGASGTGIVFLSGAHIDPAAYASKLSGIVDGGVTVVIARPILNLAILENRPLTTFTGLAPTVNRWYVAGHSLGGVRACQYAKDDYTVAGLILFGSYCGIDVSSTSIPVLSIGGSRDGLTTPSKIRSASHLLPVDATFITIPGADHADFGDYGPQAGDLSSTTTDASVRSQIANAVLGFVG